MDMPDLTKKVGPFPLWAWGLGGTALLYELKRRSAASAANTAAAPTDGAPVNVASTGDGGYVTGGLGGGDTVVVGPDGGGAVGTTAASPTQQAAGPVACTPPFPWHWVGGTLIDSVSGRPAFYGVNSQPGMGWDGTSPLDPGLLGWRMPDGRHAKYDPNNWSYSDSSRPPVCH